MIVSNIIFKLTIIIMVAVVTPLSSFAETGKTTDASISELLRKVKESKGDARRKAMNALKLKLRTVNAATRAKTLQELRYAFGGTTTQPTSNPVHSIQQIPHQQIQQITNKQHMINAPHQTNPAVNPTPPKPTPPGGRP